MHIVYTYKFIYMYIYAYVKRTGRWHCHVHRERGQPDGVTSGNAEVRAKNHSAAAPTGLWTGT